MGGRLDWRRERDRSSESALSRSDWVCWNVLLKLTTLKELYEALRQHDGAESYSQEIFDQVDIVVSELGEEGIANRLLEETPREEAFAWGDTATILSMMIWSTSDNGAGITNASEQWVNDCNDERRVFVALHLDTYPFKEYSDMVAALRRVVDRFPALSDRCEFLVNTRNRE